MEVTKSRKKLNNAVTGSLAVLATIDTTLYEKLIVQLTVATNALNQFTIQGQVQGDAPFVALATATTDFTTPKYPMLRASGDLAAQAVGNGWFAIDCSSFVAIKISAASGNVAGSVVDVYWGLRDS